MWFNPSEPWPQSRPWPTDWKENTVKARGFYPEPDYSPQRVVNSLLVWSAATLVGSAAVVAGGILVVAKWVGGSAATNNDDA